MAKSSRRSFLAKAPAVAVAAAAAASPVLAADKGNKADKNKPVKKVLWTDGKRPEKQALFSPAVSYGNLLFKKKLEAAGSSMEKVLKVNVYLNDLKDYPGMNEVFLGKFGPEPGVRTTIAAAGGIPGNSLVEIDCIAYI